MVEKAKHEISDQLKEVTIQLRQTEELKKEAEDQAFFMKDEIKELHDEVKSGIDKAARLNNEVNKDDAFQNQTWHTPWNSTTCSTSAAQNRNKILLNIL